MADVGFTNLYSSKIYVAYMRYDAACGADCGDPWDVLGWINLEPGQTQTRSNPTGSRWFYYYAEADDGSVWGGNFFGGDVHAWAAFQKCTCLGVSVSHGQNPWYEVGMDQLDLAEWGGVNFTG